MDGKRPPGGVRSIDVRAPAHDQEWFVLTEGLTPYERFRFIATHVLNTALKDASRYAVDQRIFPDAAGEDALRAHLGILDLSLQSDPGLSSVQREFLCAVVASAMRDQAVAPACLGDVIRGLVETG